MDKKLAIGIDLGTTFCCAYVIRNGTHELIANKEGHRTTPSKVYLGEKIIVGSGAENDPDYNIKNEIFDVKRIIGCMFDDSSVQNLAKQVAYEMERGKNGDILIKFYVQGKLYRAHPEQISAIILKYFKQRASEYLGQEITEAVITVPAYFNTMQRQATREAAKIAGLEVLSLINEPSAAALAYACGGFTEFSDDRNKEKKILIYDLGGGTFDVSLVSINKRNINVLAVAGDTNLGGTDFLNLLYDHITKELGSKLTNNDELLKTVKVSCQNVVMSLSKMEKSQLNLFYLGCPKININRDMFNELNKKLFTKTMLIVEECIRLSKLKLEDIDEVLLVGGSTRIPKIEELLANYFGKQKVKKYLNPDEAVAIGAAYQAAFLKGQLSKSLSLVDVVPLSIGISQNNSFLKCIPRNTQLPTHFIGTYKISSEQLNLSFFEGESEDVSANVLLGAIKIPPRNKNKTEYELKVEININNDQDINIKVTELSTNYSEEKRLKLNAERMSKRKIESLYLALEYLTID